MHTYTQRDVLWSFVFLKTNMQLSSSRILRLFPCVTARVDDLFMTRYSHSHTHIHTYVQDRTCPYVCLVANMKQHVSCGYTNSVKKIPATHMYLYVYSDDFNYTKIILRTYIC